MPATRLLRYRYLDGSVQAALPLHVVTEDDDVLVGWTPDGTQAMYWALADGRDPRSVPLEQRFAGTLTTARRVWRGDVLRVIPFREHFQVLHFWEDDGEFAGWYVNLESTKTRRGACLDATDWHLDLWIGPDLVPRWKDADEADVAVRAGQLRADDLAAAREQGLRLLDRIDTWPDPVGDWRAFRPPPSWRPLALPGDWDSDA